MVGPWCVKGVLVVGTPSSQWILDASMDLRGRCMMPPWRLRGESMVRPWWFMVGPWCLGGGSMVDP